MNIQVVTYPQNKLYEGKIDPSKTVDEIIAQITKSDASDRVLIIDRNQNFHRITEDDAICRHYNGRLGEIFRITDGSAVRYRIVSPPIIMAKEKGKAKRVTADIYASAYENTLTMLHDRGCDSETLSRYAMPRDQLMTHFKQETIKNLSIPGLEHDDPQLIDSRGRAVYVFFLSPDDDVVISRRGAIYRGILLTYMNEVVKHHNSISTPKFPSYDIADLQDEALMKTFAARFEIVIIYNNPLSKTEHDPGVKPKFHQAFPVQNLSFVVTQHVEQPMFTLLNADRDRQEIRNIYAQNGRILEGDKSFESYGLRDNIRLILI